MNCLVADAHPLINTTGIQQIDNSLFDRQLNQIAKRHRPIEAVPIWFAKPIAKCRFEVAHRGYDCCTKFLFLKQPMCLIPTFLIDRDHIAQCGDQSFEVIIPTSSQIHPVDTNSADEEPIRVNR